jgi:hypothetical protein
MTSSFAWLASNVVELKAPVVELIVARFKLVPELPSKRYSPLVTGVGADTGVGVGVGAGLPFPPQPITTMICKPRMIVPANFMGLYSTLPDFGNSGDLLPCPNPLASRPTTKELRD